MKKLTTVRIEAEILEKAKKHGLNISKTCENALRQAITALESLNTQTIVKQADPSKREVSEPQGSDKGMLRAGFEPASPARKLRNLPFSLKEVHFEAVDWEAFYKWLLQSHRERIAKDVVSYARRFAHCLLKWDLSEVAVLRCTLRRHVLEALSNLAKFLGVYEEYRRLIKSYGISWAGKSVDDLVIERLVKRINAEEVWRWVKSVKAVLPKYSVFMDFIAITGLRLEEAVKSYNLIIGLAKTGRLNEYYNEANECLEHYRFKDLFIRRTKKAFISFVPKQLIKKIVESQPIASKYVVQQRVKDKKLPVRFSDIRELHASTLTRHLSQPEIDFLHGRVSANVFMANYFNPKLIGDLKERVFKAIMEIQSFTAVSPVTEHISAKY